MSNSTASNSTSVVPNPVFQNAYYIGNNINGILYGVELVLYFISIRQLVESYKATKKRVDIFYMWFSTGLLLLVTIFVAVQAVFGEEMWIVNAGFPGGDAAYLKMYASVWYQTMGTASTVILNLLTDGLMIWRCFVIWNDARIVAFPCLLYLATLAIGTTQLYYSGLPSGNFFAGLAADLGLAYYTCSIGLNVLVTCFICGRILAFARRTKKTLGREAMRTYTSTVSIIIESALPYSLSGIAFLITYGLNSDISILFLSFYILFTCLSSQLIILRVTLGRAWTRERASQSVSTLSFTFRPTLSVYTGNTDATAINLRTMAKSNGSAVEVGKV
ncbi:hypothetical protein SCP_1200800 [Sparassis crispa]|uniref:Uncharacterized protein n=1 Tax=Sparassis crispa TaxID=139825 RepID=A0A401H0A6_9APHY|nr:hypothetical protein SCP_1200800 [Sparassis crispa]GBE87855.1 hypothetical protein SCP_1200800 [Sparassis crispa]